jgi:hypothetical protein
MDKKNFELGVPAIEQQARGGIFCHEVNLHPCGGEKNHEAGIP